MFRFESPYFLAMLALIPVLIYVRRRKSPHPAMGLPALASVRGIASSLVLKSAWIVTALKYLTLCLVIVAMARPQWGTRLVSVKTEGINIVLAVDVSESMAALDFRKNGKVVNRLQAVKSVVNEFISRRNGDRVGMVVFGTHAYTQVPLTRDYNTIVSILERIEIGSAGKNTAVGDAIGISLKRLEDIPSKTNVIILLTDGQSNTGELSPEAATEIATQKEVKIYTVGVGTRGKAPFLVRHPLWGERYVYQQVDIDEDALRQISKKTRAVYFRAENIEGLREIYDSIDRLEKTEVKVKTYAEYRELYFYFLTTAFMILAMWVVLSNTRFLRLP